MLVEEYYKQEGIVPDEEGWYDPVKPAGGLPVKDDEYLDSIRKNVCRGHERLKKAPYDRRTFVYVGAGPTMQNYLWEIAAMCGQPERYLVTCSNKTAKYLLANDIVPHVHWIIDPKQSKAADFEVTHEDTEYWLNVGCHPDVFDMVEKQNRKIKVFIAASNVGGEQLDTRECHEAMKEHGLSPWCSWLEG